MKIQTDVILPSECDVGHVISAINSCAELAGLREVPMGKDGRYCLWEPDPVDECSSIEKIEGRGFQKNSSVTLKFSTNSECAYFFCVMFSSKNRLNIIDIESDGPWCTIENFEQGDLPEWLENSKRLYSLACCLHAKLNAVKTVSYYDESPENPLFLLLAERGNESTAQP
ncbi:hypothetical protein [Roseibacillus ishigakijimensis]|uniref:Uncharacterized protein n=1 Tax=Roseibacillus ishigakijimensis TaxID=454146 RepID=A0A934RT20_9BACT|nr:hypothetical protein [Roseibacillus ishigakijimensis]MBK1835407.1 hypothetical protein [Roseibacillus ishigakijimensis]